MPDRGDRRHVHRHHFAVRHRAGHVQRVPRLLSRVQATVLIGVASIGFIFVGRFAFNLVQSVSTFAVLIVTCTTRGW
ncbi:hypothetical protein P4133_06855 [Pseudomonas aeruginosa]|nr:hypothetical protein [Pseudomonas aeruginosa]